MTQAAEIVELARTAVLFHSPQGEAYICIDRGGHQETHELKTSAVRRWFMGQFHKRNGKPPTPQAVDGAMQVLEARAIFDKPEMKVYVRVAGEAGSIYLDLANKTWQAVQVTQFGWQIVNAPAVKFRRPAGMSELPSPEVGGSIEDLRPFVNVADEDSWRLLISWLVGALNPEGPYPVLELHGPQGAAKSTACRVIKALIDPSSSPLRARPGNERDVFISGTNAWILAFDNLSGIPDWFSDCISRVATGGGFATRKLYADAEEMQFDLTRAVLLNGIGDQATRGDLLDRTIILPLRSIPEDKRRSERDFWDAFEMKRAGILGALLDATVMALKNVNTVHLARSPRMADFARWACAASGGLGWSQDDFLDAYARNRAGARARILEADPVGTLLLELLRAEAHWEGTATELLQKLESIRSYRSLKLPGSASALSVQLTRLQPTLADLGVRIEMGSRVGPDGTRIIVLEYLANAVSVVSAVGSREGEG